jgi:hypothetical protein
MINDIIMINNLPTNVVNVPVLNQTFKNYILNQALTDDHYNTYMSLLELFKKHNYDIMINQIKYRVIDGENINNVFIDIIKNNSDMSMEITTYLNTLYEIENYYWILRFT